MKRGLRQRLRRAMCTTPAHKGPATITHCAQSTSRGRVHAKGDRAPTPAADAAGGLYKQWHGRPAGQLGRFIPAEQEPSRHPQHYARWLPSSQTPSGAGAKHAPPAARAKAPSTTHTTLTTHTARSTQPSPVSLTLLQVDDVVAARQTCCFSTSAWRQQTVPNGFKASCSAPNCTGIYTEAEQSA